MLRYIRQYTTRKEIGNAFVALLIVILLLIGIEAFLRTDWAFSRLPMPRPYYSFGVTRRLHYLEQLKEKRGEIDVLFVGSSVVRSNINPKKFDEMATRKIGRQVTSFNAGFSKMYPTGAALYVEHIWLDQARPKILVHGVREVELGSQMARPYYLRHGWVEKKWMENSRLANIEALFIQNLRIVQYRGKLTTFIDRISAGEPLYREREHWETGTDERGHRLERRTLRRARRYKSKRLWKYRGKRKASRYKRSIGAIKRIHQLCREHGTRYILVHMPEHPDRFNDPTGPIIWADYKKRTRTFSKKEGIPFVDVTKGELKSFADDRFYADYHHFSPLGAIEFSKLLADGLAVHLN